MRVILQLNIFYIRESTYSARYPPNCRFVEFKIPSMHEFCYILFTMLIGFARLKADISDSLAMHSRRSQGSYILVQFKMWAEGWFGDANPIFFPCRRKIRWSLCVVEDRQIGPILCRERELIMARENRRKHLGNLGTNHALFTTVFHPTRLPLRLKTESCLPTLDEWPCMNWRERAIPHWSSQVDEL